MSLVVATKVINDLSIVSDTQLIYSFKKGNLQSKYKIYKRVFEKAILFI